SFAGSDASGRRRRPPSLRRPRPPLAVAHSCIVVACLIPSWLHTPRIGLRNVRSFTPRGGWSDGCQRQIAVDGVLNDERNLELPDVVKGVEERTDVLRPEDEAIDVGGPERHLVHLVAVVRVHHLAEPCPQPVAE